MRVVLTGSSGRVGRAIYNDLALSHDVIGIDRSPFSTTRIVADFADPKLLRELLQGADAVIHSAALHAPHVNLVPDSEFRRINVEGTRLIIQAAQELRVKRFVFTSTTAVFGQSFNNGLTSWVDDATNPNPRTIYHSTKLEAEELLRDAAGGVMAVRILRMSRCFPEPAPVMALHRLNRGIDVRDVATAHRAALTNEGPDFQNFIISGRIPFLPTDCEVLATNLELVLQKRLPEFLTAFRKRGWNLPLSIDRIYDSSQAEAVLGWKPTYGYEEVLAQLDRRSLEVLPVHCYKGQSDA